jgi:hypothetical protein
LFGASSIKEIQAIKYILTLFYEETKMDINNRKSFIRFFEMEFDVKENLGAMFSIEVLDIEA